MRELPKNSMLNVYAVFRVCMCGKSQNAMWKKNKNMNTQNMKAIWLVFGSYNQISC